MHFSKRILVKLVGQCLNHDGFVCDISNRGLERACQGLLAHSQPAWPPAPHGSPCIDGDSLGVPNNEGVFKDLTWLKNVRPFCFKLRNCLVTKSELFGTTVAGGRRQQASTKQCSGSPGPLWHVARQPCLQFSGVWGCRAAPTLLAHPAVWTTQEYLGTSGDTQLWSRDHICLGWDRSGAYARRGHQPCHC